MKIIHNLLLFAGIALCCLLHSCKKKNENATNDSGYPPAIAKIMINKCATSGCHNIASYANAGNLQLDTWEHLFNGSNNGAVVVPYSSLFSPLMYYINTDYSLGPVALPTMPLGANGNSAAPLSDEEFDAIQTWIANGAPNNKGAIAFSADAATRQKIYITQQGCDLVAVIDAQSKVIMRYIKVGATPAITEGPSYISVAADGSSFYLNFTNSNYMQQIATVTDTVTATTNLANALAAGTGSQHILFSGTSLVATSGAASGSFTRLSTPALSVSSKFDGLIFPYSIAANLTNDTFIVTSRYGNSLYKIIDKNGGNVSQLSINGASVSTTHTSGSPDPYQVVRSPDGSRYFITCQNTNEVRVIDAQTDSLVAVIQVGAAPQQMAFSKSHNYLFVSCMEDAGNTTPGCRGSVYVINYNSLSVSKVIYGDFYEPQGIAVDEMNARLYVVSSNQNPSGPPAHHSTACGGNAGWYSVYNLNSLSPDDGKRYELTKQPFCAMCRF